MIVEMLTGGVIALTSATLGFALARLSPERRSESKQGKPICGCDHERAFHNLKTGECREQVQVVTKTDEWGDPIKWVFEQCKCQHYTGPEPITQYYAPEIES
ncbi:hypothetical protein GCM10010149_88090 [Nonomuraea roseoviolacea subsp. roseoviolacea]|uniref:hypothetical protein n=1 Tax=Nonomuraea roseoviolacea TaxID=103837 RepID=UPI0031D3FCAB